MELRGFYFITDSNLSHKPDVDVVREAVDGGCCVVQYREKNRQMEEMLRIASKIRDLTRDKAYFIVNDNLDLALEAGADGIHLGQEDFSFREARYVLGKDMIIGVTVHNVREALDAEADGADYLGVSPIFATNTKPDAGLPAGVQLIRDVKSKVSIPVAAIGGINEANVDSVIAAGADMVCAISATVCKFDVKASVEYFSNKYL
ncbi:MAG: thiamine phosphate synthase [Candidatus Altiarchaeota archaeon]